ncbi:MAG: hypothetical protein ACOCQV_01690 [Halolamina sp.]
MRPRSSLHLVLVALIGLSAVAAIPVADARAPPTPVCGVCSVDTTVDGTAVASGESALTIKLHENGSTTWVAAVTLTEGGDTVAENESLRRAVVAESVDDGIATPEYVRSGTDGEVLTVRYRDSSAIERHAGALVFTPLTPEGPDRPFAMGGEGSRYLAADRLTVRAPQGYDLHGDADATESSALVWRNESSDRRSLDVESDPVAVDADAGAPGIRVWVARLLR